MLQRSTLASHVGRRCILLSQRGIEVLGGNHARVCSPVLVLIELLPVSQGEEC